MSVTAVGRLLAGLLAGLTAAVTIAGLASAECRLQHGGAHVVTKVIDTETLALDDGSEVRLIGALGPRARDGDAAEGGWAAEDAARAALARLVGGKSVRLKFGGDRRDRHDRLLAHVFVQGDEGQETWVQVAMLTAGHARAYAIQGNHACEAELLDAEAAARREGRGLWSVPTYRLRNAKYPREFGAMAGSFRIVTGTVRHVSNRREGYRIWFDAEGRRGELTVAVRSNDRDLIGALGGDLKALVGRKIEVRGWVDRRAGAAAGPEIDVSTAGMIRVADAP